MVPNVAGLPYLWAIDALEAAGLEADTQREEAPDGTTGPDEQYTVVQQDVAPTNVAACGSVVTLTAAYRPGTLHIVEPGETYGSIAAAENITIESLLVYNGLLDNELQTVDESTIEPPRLGQALRLTPGPAPQRFAFTGPASELVVTEVVDRQGGVVSLMLKVERFAGATVQVNIVPGQFAEPPTDFQPEPVAVRQTDGVLVRPPDGSISVLWQEGDELAIEVAAIPETSSSAIPTGADLIEIANALVAVDDTEWAEFRIQFE